MRPPADDKTGAVRIAALVVQHVGAVNETHQVTVMGSELTIDTPVANQ